MIVILTSCKQEEKKNLRVVTFYQYHVWVSDLGRIDLKDSLVFYIDTIEANGETSYLLKSDLDSDIVGFTYSIIHDSLIYESTYCEVLDTVNLDYNGEEISLYRSNYDEQASVDEESYIFWNHKYGVVGLYNYSMGPLLLLEDMKTPNFAKKVLYEYVVEMERKRRK